MAQRGSARRPTTDNRLGGTSQTPKVVNDFRAAQTELGGFKHASAQDLVKAGFRQATLVPNGVEGHHSFDKQGLSDVVLEFENAEGVLVREVGLLADVYQNHVTLFQGQGLGPRTFINFGGREEGVRFTGLFVRDAGLEQVKGWDARRLIAGEEPSVVWFHYRPEPDSEELRFIFGRVTPGPEHITVTTPDGRKFKFHPDFLDELASSASYAASFSASPLRGELSRRFPVSRGVPPAGRIGKKTEVSTPYTEVETQHQTDVHTRLTHALYNGEIVRIGRDLHYGVVWEVKLRSVDATTGEPVISDAVMKVRVWGDKRGWHQHDYYRGYGRTPMEYVGYFINRLLKMDIVPPVAYRRGLNLVLPSGHNVTEAALIHYVPNLETRVSTLPISSDARVHANVFQDPDLSGANYGSGNHWVDGRLHDVRFDMSAAGSNMYGTGGAPPLVISIRRTVYDALRAWTVDDLHPLVQADFITQREAESFIANGKVVLEYVDQLVERAKGRGRDVQTVITPD